VEKDLPMERVREPLVEEPLGAGQPLDPGGVGEDAPSEGEIALEREMNETRATPRR
jgi:hypothetical protein